MAEIWPRFRKTLQRKSTRSSRKKSNPYASVGLDKFATLLEEIHSKQQATTSLVERTASSLSAVRSISRSAQEWTASTLVRTIHSQSDTTAKQNLQSAALVGELQRENVSEESRQPQGSGQNEEPVTSSSKNSATLTLGVRLPTVTRCRVLTSKSAFLMVLVALGAFLSSRAGKFGKQIAAVLTLSAVIRIWRKGKVSARFIFSSVALYLLSPLRSYLVTRIPKPLSLLPRKNPEDSNEDAQPERIPDTCMALQSEVIPALLPIPECSPVTQTPPPHSTGSPSRRLAKKISSRWKKLKIFKKLRSSSSASISLLTVPESSAVTDSVPSPKSPSNHRRMCPFSRRAEAQSPSSSHQGSSKCGVGMRRQQSSEEISCSSKGSRLNRMLSSETLDQFNQLQGEGSGSSKHSSGDHHDAGVAWPVVGLLVTLLFLIVGRVPAIVATSLFFVVVSPHSRARGRENRANWEAAARKLQRSPPPSRGGRRRAGTPEPQSSI